MRPAPSHLDAILLQRKPLASQKGQSGVGGRIGCECGSTEFTLQYVGNRVNSDGSPFLRATMHWGRTFFSVAIECARCSKARTLLDLHRHGWEGLLCSTANDRMAKPPRPKQWTCPSCRFSVHEINIEVRGDDKSEALKNGEGALNESNWFDAFGSMSISTVCASCGAAQWAVDCETQ